MPPLRPAPVPVALALLAACAQDYAVVPEPVDVDPGQVTDCPFTRVEGTAFWAYDCNPVFATTGEDWADTIDAVSFAVTRVMDHPFYQIWYTGVPTGAQGGEYGLGYAVSADGTAWTPDPANPLMAAPPASAWDHSSMDAMQVVWDPATTQYVMLYQGYNEDLVNLALGVATSYDGSDWVRYPDNPVLDLTVGSAGVEQWCWPLGLSLAEGGGYEGYIAGVTDARRGACEVYRLDAADLRAWTPSGDVVLAAGEPGAWDDQGFVSIAQAELHGTKYMFYAGFGDWEAGSDGYSSSSRHFLGMATKRDGRWEKEPDPVPLHRTERGDVVAVAAVTVGERVHLWVTDDYDGVSAVGYFLFDPARAAEEDG